MELSTDPHKLVAAIEAGHRVCLVEADPLGTVSNWRRRRTSAEPMVETVHDGYVLFNRVQALAHRGMLMRMAITILSFAGAVGVARHYVVKCYRELVVGPRECRRFYRWW